MKGRDERTNGRSGAGLGLRAAVLLLGTALLIGAPLPGGPALGQSGSDGTVEPGAEATSEDDPDDEVCSPEEAPSQMETEDEALAHDMAMVAQDEGWSCEEAERRLRGQDAFAELSAEMERKHPEAFAGAKQEDGPEGTRYVMRFVGAVPAEARAGAEQAGLEVVFEGGARASKAELKRRAEEIVDDLREAGFESGAVGPRAADGIIFGHLTRPLEYRYQDGRRDDELREEFPESARADDVVIRFMDEPFRTSQGTEDTQDVLDLPGLWGVGTNSSAPDRVVGGGVMEVASDPVALCTSGFVVSHDSGTRGVTTAAHCGPSFDRYQNPENSNVYDAPMRGRCWDDCREQLGDFQWHETSYPHHGNFYWNHDNDGRRVFTVASQYRFRAGQRYCGFGRNRASEPDCAEVIDPDTTCWGDFGAYGRQVKVDDDFSVKGDSGGPWFWGYLAAGTATLRADDGAVCFSRAGLIDNTHMEVDVVARDRKVRGDRMVPGNRVWSHNGDYMLIMQEDGNLVLYGPNGARWASGTGVDGAWAIMQTDGNFVIYTPGGSALWATGTSGSGNKIIAQDDGNLVVYTPNEHALWGCC